MGLFKRKELLGLDLGSNSIKLVQLNSGKQGWQLVKLGIAYLPPEAIVDGSIIDSMTVADTIRGLVKEHGGAVKSVASALTGHSVIIKKVSLPVMSEEDLAESIQWEAEQYIPFPVADVNIDFQILGVETETSGQMDVMLVAVKKDVINDYVNVIKDAGLEPAVVDVDSFALENMLEINYTLEPNENVAIVNVGASITVLSILVGGVTVFTRAIPMGGNQFAEEIQKELNISFKDAEAVKLGQAVEGTDAALVEPIMQRLAEKLAVEIKRSIEFFLGGSTGIYVNKIFLSGGASRAKGLPETIEERTAIPVEMINPFQNIVCNEKNFDPDYLREMAPYFAVGLGLAMRQVGDK
ncbi:MAG: type IV pilus assembly protein PilM [Thermodesulfobacteriota bacterium]